MPIVSLTLPAAAVVAAYLLGRHRSRQAARQYLDSELARQRAELARGAR
jgi:predicted LPLAT superfamily acyltransferase